MHSPSNMERHHQLLKNLSWGQSRYVKTWNNYIVNNFKFNTREYESRKCTNNCSVRVKGNYYETLTDVIQVELVTYQAEQVSCIKYIGAKRQRSDRLVVIKSRTRVFNVPRGELVFQENMNIDQTSIVYRRIE